MATFQDWSRYFGSIQVEPGKNVRQVKVTFIAEDTTGIIRCTDLQLQAGATGTGYMPAYREFLKRERDGDGTIVRKRHFNVVIRGKKTIAVPNRALPRNEAHLKDRVTGGMDFTFRPSQETSPTLYVSNDVETRRFYLFDPLQSGDIFEYKATDRTIRTNGEATANVDGPYQTVPAVLGKYIVAVPNTEDQDGEYHGSGYLLCEADTWLKGKGGAYM